MSQKEPPRSQNVLDIRLNTLRGQEAGLLLSVFQHAERTQRGERTPFVELFGCQLVEQSIDVGPSEFQR